MPDVEAVVNKHENDKDALGFLSSEATRPGSAEYYSVTDLQPPRLGVK